MGGWERTTAVAVVDEWAHRRMADDDDEVECEVQRQGTVGSRGDMTVNRSSSIVKVKDR